MDRRGARRADSAPRTRPFQQPSPGPLGPGLARRRPPAGPGVLGPARYRRRRSTRPTTTADASAT
ncbi:hypothetical protein, partial [Streptosporangium nondiastaticum]|uniref:hypothetical protein n=1 Tax=Streptosporangium nondiastaticum TaxID=35764 RepID=UPI001CB962C5